MMMIFLTELDATGPTETKRKNCLMTKKSSDTKAILHASTDTFKQLDTINVTICLGHHFSITGICSTVCVGSMANWGRGKLIQ